MVEPILSLRCRRDCRTPKSCSVQPWMSAVLAVVQHPLAELASDPVEEMDRHRHQRVETLLLVRVFQVVM